MRQGLQFSLAAMVLWGIWGFLPKIALRYINPYALLFYEGLGFLLVAVAVLVLTRTTPELHAKGTILGILTGVSGAMAMIFYLFALSKEKTSLAVTMTGLYPFMTILLALVILQESLTLRQIIGVAFAFIAMVFMAS